ncbi:vacuolar protein sorting-associated protein 51 homolog isoform X1 [Salvia splendens]|uniref:vacuolar protein sorting-associated protein 51 homolog isoform X1 n=1 Tax=Salvia splendens TaxID=180675 RepID=UPI001C262706|nr:vacuolar protein sorting-associated protein 51 homolog isoform X1 [Salvia splendens]
MEVEGALPMDDKAKRMRDLLSSFYSPDQSIPGSPPHNTVSRFATLDTINTTSFDADQYMNLLVQKSSLEGLLQKHVEMAAEIKNLDTDLQMLVYENYNKFISATDTIKKMKNNIVGMETNMEQLLEKITSVQSRSDGVNTSLFEKREHIEKLHRTRNLLRKVQVLELLCFSDALYNWLVMQELQRCYILLVEQFIYDLPTRLQKCIKSEAYADAVKFYTGATPIFKAYGDSSFLDCKRASEEAVSVIIKNLQGLVFSDSESIQARAESVMLLKKLDFPVENLKVKLFEKLKQFLVDLDLEYNELTNVPVNVDESINPKSASTTTHEASVHEFAEAIRAYKAIFLHSEPQLCNLGQDLVKKHFEAIHQQIMKHVRSADLLAMLRIIWTDVLLMDEVLPEASLPDFALQHARVAIKDYTCSTFSRLLMNISDTLKKYQFTVKEEMEEEYPLRAALEASKKSVIQGSMDALMDFRLLLDENPELLLKLRDLTIDWVHEGFQDFFRKLDGYFLLLSGKKITAFQDVNLIEEMPGEKISAGLVLVLAQLTLYIEQTAIPRITEELASLSAGGGVRGLATDPAEICRIFRSSGESFLHLYIKMRTQKISVLLKKRFAAPNWVKHKEPREVHMFVDLLRQELDEIRSEVKQILPEGLTHKHRRNNSNGSTTSSRSNPLRDDRLLTRSNTQKARSQLLESHLAKLFKQKMEIFTKVEHTQESVVTTIVKLSLKSFQEFVRLQTFNRSGFQQIQLDIHFLRTTLKDITEDEAAVDFLLDEVIVSSAERCLDPNPLEPPVMDRLVQAKLAKTSEQGGDEKSK